MSNPQTTEDWLKVCLEWRGLEDARLCEVCGGSGIRCYGSTATWRGSIGGMTLTNDVCNKCWGSGNADRPWPSHKRLLNDH